MKSKRSLVLDFRNSIQAVVRALGEKKIPVTQAGSEAFVRHDRNGKPILVNIPSLPDDADEKVMNAIRGFIDHEVAHILFTDSVAVNDLPKDIHGLANIFEDIRVEALMRDRFRGSAKNLNGVFDFVVKGRVKDAISRASSGSEKVSAAFMPYARGVAGDLNAGLFVSTEVDANVIRFLDGKLPFLPADLAAMTSTHDAVNVARKTHKALFEEEEQQRELTPPPSDDTEEGDSDPSNKDDETKEEPEEDSEDKEESEGEEKSEAEGKEEDGEEENDESAAKDDKSDEDEAEDDKGSKDEEDADADEPEESDAESDGDSGDADDSGDSDGSDASGNESGDAEVKDEDAGEGDESAVTSGEEFPEGVEVAGASEEDIEKAFLGDFAVDDFKPEDISSIAKELISSEVAVSSSGKYTPYSRDQDKVLRVKPLGVSDSNVTEFDESIRSMVAVMATKLKRILAASSNVSRYGGYRSGKLQSSALHRVISGDDRVFTRKVEHNAQETAVSLLIDLSGSMKSGRPSRLMLACVSAAVFGETLNRIGINFEIIGFTTSMNRRHRYIEPGARRTFDRFSPLDTYEFKRFGEKYSRDSKKSLLSASHGRGIVCAENIDGESVQIALDRLAVQPERRKILIVLSDGLPSSGLEDRSVLSRHLYDVVKNGEKDGFEIIGIGIQTDTVKKYYSNSVVVKDLSKLPTEVMKRIEEIVRTSSRKS